MELFSNRFKAILNEFPLARPVVDELDRRVQSGEDVEQVLELMQGETNKYPHRANDLMAVRYYLRTVVFKCDDGWQFRQGGVTHYVRLVRQLRHWSIDTGTPVVYVTFNYDLLLDRAMADLGLDWRDLTSYTAVEHCLIKFHGSLNWCRLCRGARQGVLLTVGSGPHTIIQAAQQLRCDGEISRLLNWPSPHPEDEQNIGGQWETVAPAMTIPVQQKVLQECPQAQIDALDKYIPEVRRILVIGWRGAEAHFWSHWQGKADSSTKVHLVNGRPRAGAGSIISPGIATAMDSLGLPMTNVVDQRIGFGDLVAGTVSRIFYD